MKILTHEDIMKMGITPEKCYEWVDYVLKNKSRMMLPSKISLKMENEIFYNTMPSILPEEGVAGVKVVSRYPDRKPSLDSQILLYDLETGKLKALLDGNFITTMRTGAVAAHSVRLFARENFETIGVIGLGNTMRAAVKVLLSLYPDRKLTLKVKKYKDQHTGFAALFADYKNLTFEMCDTYEETVRGSDVVLSAVTYAAEDFCSDACFKEGCCVIPIHTRGFTNCDLFFDKVFADDRGHVKGFKYFNQFKRFAEVSDVLAKKAAGRENEEEKILAYNIGISLHDIYFANEIYKIASKDSGCRELDLKAPEEKFWIQ